MRILTVIMLAFALAACGGSSTPPPSDPQTPPPPPAPPPPDDDDDDDDDDDGDGAPVEFPKLALVEVASGFVQPTDIQSPRDGTGRLYVVERRGVIHTVDDGEVLPEPFLDIQSRVSSSAGEQGLFGLAFAPDYASSGHFYVNYTDLDGNTVVSRFSGDADSEQKLLEVEQPFANHNGGQLAFGPDGYLYIALGDGGGDDPDGNAQDPETPLGAILRIDVSGGGAYAIPADNPFENEVWAYGLRNPWRISFDRATGDLYIADVGERSREEVNFQPAGSSGGQNYGWDIMEGTTCYATANCDPTGLTLPVWEYETGENCSITGGYVSRGDDDAALNGIYVFGDFCSGRIWGIARDGEEWVGEELLDSSLRITTFGEDEAGRLYVAGFSSGTIHRLVID